MKDQELSFREIIEKQCKYMGVTVYQMFDDLKIEYTNLDEWYDTRKYHFDILLIADYLHVSPKCLFNSLSKSGNSVYYRIKSLCESRGLKVNSYLNSLGYPLDIIYSWKSRTSTSIKNKVLVDLAQKLDCTTDYLLGITNETHKNSDSLDANTVLFLDKFEELDVQQQIDLLKYIDYLMFKKRKNEEEKKTIKFEIPDSDKDIIQMRRQGMTLVQIANAKHVTKQCISQKLMKYNVVKAK